MKVDGRIGALAGAAREARALEASGYDGAWTAEAAHDPFLPLAAAAETTRRLELGTGIAVAFARTPMALAVIANDVQLHTGGRLLLGIGSQVRAHIERRYSMPWSHPAARMREFVLAMRAIWAAWNERTPLCFEGAFYTHSLMPPFFDPGPNPYGPPRVFCAAVGPRMAAVAGEVADGLILHSFTTEAYVRRVIQPALETALEQGGRRRADFEVACPVFVATGSDEEEITSACDAVRAQIAFYASTPAYRPVLAIHGWEDLQVELNTLARASAWEQMGRLVSDEVLAAFAFVGEPEVVVGEITRRLADVVDRVSFYTPYRCDPACTDRLLTALRTATTPARAVESPSTRM